MPLRRWPTWSAALLAFCALVAAISYTLLPSGPISAPVPLGPNDDYHSLWQYKIIGDVPRIQYDSTKTNLAAIVANYPTPVVLTGLTASAFPWKALQRWTPDYIVNKCGSLVFRMKVKETPVFTYTEPKPLLELPEWASYKSPERTKKFSIWELFKPFRGGYRYFTGYLARSEDDTEEFPCLTDDIQPLTQFAITQEAWNMNLWLGSPKVVAQTHFDESPNFNMQVYGTKRWILSPPEEAEKIYTFPYLFPAYRQSQVDFWSRFKNESVVREMVEVKATSGSELFPRLGNISAYEVTMRAGEILYIPPYYFHRVITEDVSIAVNTWSEPPEGSLHENLASVPLPLESSWPLGHRSWTTRAFLADLAAELAKTSHGSVPESRTPRYWFDLVKEQYMALYGSIGLTPDSLLREKEQLACERTEEVVPEFGRAKEEFERKIQGSERETYIGRRLAQLGRLAHSPGAQRLIFSAFIEEVALAVLGVEYVPAFILHCLDRVG